MLGVHKLGNFDLKYYTCLIRCLIKPPLVFALIQLSNFSLLVIDRWWPLVSVIIKLVVLLKNTGLFSLFLSFFITDLLLEIALSTELFGVAIGFVGTFFLL